MKPLAPALCNLVDKQGWDAANLAFYVVHAGSLRILDDLCKYLKVDGHAFRHSRVTLTEYGNIASAVVLDALHRLFEGHVEDHGRGAIAGFSPGITAEMATGTWVRHQSGGGPTLARGVEDVTAGFGRWRLHAESSAVEDRQLLETSRA